MREVRDAWRKMLPIVSVSAAPPTSVLPDVYLSAAGGASSAVGAPGRPSSSDVGCCTLTDTDDVLSVSLLWWVCAWWAADRADVRGIPLSMRSYAAPASSMRDEVQANMHKPASCCCTAAFIACWKSFSLPRVLGRASAARISAVSG
ncbi:hypothetical protein DUNSADRAFT_15211 [Dunaliella salina]|uniref:Encoded protein n=1 Tax=Dunaliella salina TaxID=3046 RepID=A0ABQ7G5U7_DUNSA|nr:hypothetical protein DUNSADRAFT_15211 [Dunaliella salina]|eukprot:KAF5829975.1 hypothetical protein DUNSADRAFT_15211 [Dunaliella salina]